MLRYFSIAAFALVLSTQAHGVILTSVEGTVKITHGRTTTAVTKTTEIKPGATVRTGVNSAATIYYDNGCSIELTAKQSIVVPEELKGLKDDEPCPPPRMMLPNGPPTALIAGAAALGGAALLGGGAGRGRPASP